MTFEVLVEELRAAAAEHLTIADKLSTQPVEMTEEKPDTVGHVELALWMNAVGDQIVKAHRALRDGQDQLSDSLTAAVADYERTLVPGV